MCLPTRLFIWSDYSGHFRPASTNIPSVYRHMDTPVSTSDPPWRTTLLSRHIRRTPIAILDHKSHESGDSLDPSLDTQGNGIDVIVVLQARDHDRDQPSQHSAMNSTYRSAPYSTSVSIVHTCLRGLGDSNCISYSVLRSIRPLGMVIVNESEGQERTVFTARLELV